MCDSSCSQRRKSCLLLSSLRLNPPQTSVSGRSLLLLLQPCLMNVRVADNHRGCGASADQESPSVERLLHTHMECQSSQ